MRDAGAARCRGSSFRSSSGAVRDAFNGKIVFRANDGTLGIELYGSDGTTAGTQLVRDINVGSAGGVISTAFVLASSGNRVLFCANDGTTGTELWSPTLRPPARACCSTSTPVAPAA